MIRYFPIETPRFELTMNARAYEGGLIEVDPQIYREQIELRRQIVDSDPSYYHSCAPDQIAPAWETAGIVLADMAESYPEHFSAESRGGAIYWTNRLLDHSIELPIGEPAPPGFLSPLDWLGSQVQEDIILMRQERSGSAAICVAGHLCFAAGWSLEEKIGQSFLQIHEEVPLFAEQIGAASDLLMRRLKAGRPVMRYNWTIAEASDLNRAPKLRHAWIDKGKEVTATNAGETCFFRVEKQTLSRLPKTGAILFTIRTFVNSIAEVCEDPERRRLLSSALVTMPADTVRYKRAEAYIDALKDYVGS